MASTDDSDMYARAEIVALQSRLDIERGEPARARERLERTLDLVAAKLGADLPIYAGLLAVAAQADEATGDTDPALEKALRAEEIQRAHQLETGRMLDEHGALAQGGYRTAYLNRALQLALGTSRPQLRERAWDALAHSRGLVFEEIAQRSRMARESSDPRVARVAGKLAAARDELARLTVRGPGGLSPEEFRARLANARAKKKAAEEELADLDGRLRDRSRESDARLAQRLEALPASSALVSYVRCEPDGDDAFYLAFVSPATRAAPIVAKLGAAREIDALVSRTCMAARNSLDLDEYRSVAAELRKRVFDPLAEALRGAREILVIPDGALALVNFAALPVGDSAYLVESGVLFRTLCAERDLAPLDDATVDETPSGRGLLALGGPSFDGRVPLLAKADVSSTSSLGRPRSASVELPASYAALSFHPLPGAAAEIARVKSLWLASLPTATDRHDDSDGVLSFTGDAATEANFKEHAPGRRVLHIATHGFFVRSERAARASNARGVSSSRPPLVVSTALPLEPSEDPLLLSGLAFAGANHRGDATDDADDGILTAEEIAHLDLSSVDCAVLSACETGLGEIASGEGIFGLRRAFQLAGVRSLVVSLWPVDDDTTSAWMTEFYGAGIADGGDTAVAVRAASLATLEARRSRGESEHPYYWCAFMAIGPTRAPRAESTVADTGMDTTTGRR
jgi:CHAT domain-containing protein